MDYPEFWAKYFPEMSLLNRTRVLLDIRDHERGLHNLVASPEENRTYQDDVALVYGAYEPSQYQFLTVAAFEACNIKPPPKEGVADRTKMICADCADTGLINQISPGQAQIVLSINAMHWSPQWRQWISNAAKLAKPGGQLFLTCSLQLPGTPLSRGNITAETLASSIRQTTPTLKLVGSNMLIPPQNIGDGMAALSGRFYVHLKRSL